MKRAKLVKRTFVKTSKPIKNIKAGNGGGMQIPDSHGTLWPVLDAKKPMLLEVNDDDVKHSTLGRLEPGSCAAACAIMRQEGVEEAKVFRTKTYTLRKLGAKKKFWERYQTPTSLRIELGAFDKGGEFESQRFKLNTTPPSTKPGYRKVKLTVPGRSTALPRKSNHTEYGDYPRNATRKRLYKPVKVRPRPIGFSK